MELQTRVGIGVTLALIGGLAISIDIPLIRLAESNPWVVMFARGTGLFTVLGLIIIFDRGVTQTPKRPFSDYQWVEVGILYGMSSILFTLSVFYTSTANLVFILAFNPLLAALFSWWIFGEKPGFVTWIALGITVLGVGIIVANGLETGTFFGNLTSLAAAVVLALSLTRTRQSGKDLSLSGCLGGLITALFSLPLMITHFEIPGVPIWLVLNVLILVPLSGFSLTLAPRFIPAAQVALFFLLETVLAPIWVWLIFSEEPGDATLLGGALVLLAVFGHSAFQFWEDHRRRQTVHL